MSGVIALFNYWAVVVLMMVGFYTLIARGNLVKKLIGLYILQTSVIFFLVAFSAKQGATVPVIRPDSVPVNALEYANPLPHVLTVTAIVVQVATLGVSLALVSAAYRKYRSLDESELLQKTE